MMQANSNGVFPIEPRSNRGTFCAQSADPNSAAATDLALVVRAQSGATRAFDALVTKYRGRIFKLALRFVRNPADADDVVQETFLKAYRALGQFRGHCAFYSWLYRIAINAARTAIQCRARDRHFLSSEELSDDEGIEVAVAGSDLDTPEHLALTAEICRAVNESIAELNPEQRTAIVLREFDGYTYLQLALAMGCPVGTVRSRVFRAREAVDLRVRSVFTVGLGRSRAASARAVGRCQSHAPRILSPDCGTVLCTGIMPT
jgi:RNA polymerase sigma-70 factor (ECF subfamily)